MTLYRQIKAKWTNTNRVLLAKERRSPRSNEKRGEVGNGHRQIT